MAACMLKLFSDKKLTSTSWPVFYGGGEALVHGGRTDPSVDVDGVREGIFECN